MAHPVFARDEPSSAHLQRQGGAASLREQLKRQLLGPAKRPIALDAAQRALRAAFEHLDAARAQPLD
jgi:hypothetical protein